MYQFRVPNRPVSTYIPRPTFGAEPAGSQPARKQERMAAAALYFSAIQVLLVHERVIP